MDDLSGIRKDNVENVETSDSRNTPAQNELVQHLEQKILELQGKLEHVRNMPDVVLPEGYKPPKFEIFDGTSDPKVHLRTYCNKLVGVGKDEIICMKLFMRSLTGDAMSWFNTKNAPDVFYIQNLKKKPTKTFHEYATRWRSEVAKVRPALEEEQINKFFVRVQDPQYYKRLMFIQNHKFFDIIKLGERIKEGIKSAMWINPNNTYAYHSGMKGHIIDECRTLKDKIQTLIDTKVIQEKEAEPNIRNNPLPDHMSEGTQAPIEVEVAAPTPFEGEVTTPFTMMVAPMPSYKSNAIPWDYVAKARRKGKAKMEETGAAQGMTKTGRVYTPKNLGGTSKETASKSPVIETGPDDLWRKVQAREYSMIDHLNKTPAEISFLSLLQNSEAHRNALMKVLNEAYVPNNITSG
ncbi:uncharacterized protein [Nicotiana tomentosiformis]|uniref:uncharacterized protein n=1 Tax=Nicotiana tomentosiformis TaxID=4098 RepID=UPI00388C4601